MADEANGIEINLGRPTKYEKKFDKQVYRLCLLGATDSDIAEFFEVSERTINYWKEQHPAFLQSIKKGKSIADAEIAESLYNRAKGYSYKETTFEAVDSKAVLEATAEGAIMVDAHKKKIVTKLLPADTTAMIFWLKNRQPKNWRDKVEVNHGGQADNPIVNHLVLTAKEVNDIANLLDKEI